MLIPSFDRYLAGPAYHSWQLTPPVLGCCWYVFLGVITVTSSTMISVT